MHKDPATESAMEGEKDCTDDGMWEVRIRMMSMEDKEEKRETKNQQLWKRSNKKNPQVMMVSSIYQRAAHHYYLNSCCIYSAANPSLEDVSVFLSSTYMIYGINRQMWSSFHTCVFLSHNRRRRRNIANSSRRNPYATLFIVYSIKEVKAGSSSRKNRLGVSQHKQLSRICNIQDCKLIYGFCSSCKPPRPCKKPPAHPALGCV